MSPKGYVPIVLVYLDHFLRRQVLDKLLAEPRGVVHLPDEMVIGNA